MALAAELPELVRTPRGLAYRGAGHPAAQRLAALATARRWRSSRARRARCSGWWRRAARRLHGAPGRGLPAPGRAVPRHRLDLDARRGAGAAVQRRLLHPGQAALERPRIVRRARAGATRWACGWCYGDIEVPEQVVGYQRKRLSDHTADRPGRAGPARAAASPPRRSGSSPESTRPTGACWAPARRRARHDRPAAAAGDVRPRATSAGSRPTCTRRPARPTVFVYDGHPGGAGIAERGFELFETWVRAHRRAAGRVPVRARLPLVRAVAQVRQPQRAARQGGRRGAAAGIAG